MPTSSPVANLWPSLTQPPYSKYLSYNEDIKMEHKQVGRRAANSCFKRHNQTIRIVLIVSASFLCGVIVTCCALKWTYGLGNGQPSVATANPNSDQGYNIHLGERLMAAVSKDDMAINLRNYTFRVHITGTQGNNKLRDLLRDQLTSFGHVTVKLYSYNVLLSYHDWERPNTVTVRSDEGSVLYQTGYHGPPIENDPRPADHPELTEPYIAYSPNGSVQGRLVYAGYGRLGDFQRLRESNISCTSAVVLMKMSRVPIMNVVKRAQLFGAVGVLLFPDSNDGLDAVNTKPPSLCCSVQLPHWAARRGSLHIFGDPLTPGIPSKEFMRRLSSIEAQLPRIPVQSISMDDAGQLIRLLTGHSETDTGSEQQDYNLTKSFHHLWPKNMTVQLEVFNELERRDITNVLGVIQGREEPDRYVIVGCHFDAWTYGGVSPNTGTAIMMELVKALTHLRSTGWFPRRTIIFANWDAGEMGFIGATEWIEDREQELIDRTVTYIDLNSAIAGSSTLLVEASPLAKELAMNSAHMTLYQNPEYDRNDSTTRHCTGTTILDAWVCHNPSRGDSNIPRFDQVSIDSEHGLFYFYLGISVIWPRFVNMNSDGKLERQTPVFRTSVDTFDYVHRSVDPSFEAHKAMVGFISEMVLQLSTSQRLPLDVHELSTVLEDEFKVLCQRTRVFQDTFENLEAAIYNLSQTTAQFRNKFLELDHSKDMLIRQYNDKVLRFSRSFTSALGLPGRPFFRNLLFGSPSDDYSHIRVWPRIQDTLDLITKDSTSKDLDRIRELLTDEVSRAIAAIHSATYLLSDDIHI